MAQYSESFNKADSTTLGPNLTWTEVVGDSQVVSNSVRPVTTAALERARAEHDCATDDNFAQIISTNLASNTGANVQALCRYDSAGDNTYGYRRTGAATLGTYTAQLVKVVTGTLTVLGSAATVARTGVATAETVYVSASGSTLVGKLDGVQQSTVTDTSLTTGKRGGFSLRASVAGVTDSQADSFAMGDLLITGTAAITGTGTIAATGVRTRLGTAAITGTGVINATGLRTARTTAAITGTGTISADGTVITPAPAVTTGCDHLNEDGGLNLNEDGTIALLEGCPTSASSPGGAKNEPSYETRAYWESERRRLEIIRDDEEVLVLM